MKKNNTLLKLTIGTLIWSVSFLALAAFATNKAQESDPEIINKVESALITNGIHLEFSNASHLNAPDSMEWSSKNTFQTLRLKMITADIEISLSEESEIIVQAQGRRRENTNNPLLNIEFDQDQLNITQPPTKTIKLESAKIFLPKNMVKNLKIETVSGDLKLTKLAVKTLSVETVSGDIKGDLNATDNCKIESVSGDIEFKTLGPSHFNITSVSGDIKLKIPDSKNTQLTTKTLSGDIHTAFSSMKTGLYKVAIETLSGDIYIE